MNNFPVVTFASGKNKAVKNLGWLLRAGRPHEVNAIRYIRTSADGDADVTFIAPDWSFDVSYASVEVLLDFIKSRKAWRDVKIFEVVQESNP